MWHSGIHYFTIKSFFDWLLDRPLITTKPLHLLLVNEQQISLIPSKLIFTTQIPNQIRISLVLQFHFHNPIRFENSTKHFKITFTIRIPMISSTIYFNIEFSTNSLQNGHMSNAQSLKIFNSIFEFTVEILIQMQFQVIQHLMYYKWTTNPQLKALFKAVSFDQIVKWSKECKSKAKNELAKWSKSH